MSWMESCGDWPRSGRSAQPPHGAEDQRSEPDDQHDPAQGGLPRVELGRECFLGHRLAFDEATLGRAHYANLKAHSESCASASA